MDDLLVCSLVTDREERISGSRVKDPFQWGSACVCLAMVEKEGIAGSRLALDVYNGVLMEGDAGSMGSLARERKFLFGF